MCTTPLSQISWKYDEIWWALRRPSRSYRWHDELAMPNRASVARGVVVDVVAVLVLVEAHMGHEILHPIGVGVALAPVSPRNRSGGSSEWCSKNTCR